MVRARLRRRPGAASRATAARATPSARGGGGDPWQCPAWQRLAAASRRRLPTRRGGCTHRRRAAQRSSEHGEQGGGPPFAAPVRGGPALRNPPKPTGGGGERHSRPAQAARREGTPFAIPANAPPPRRFAPPARRGGGGLRNPPPSRLPPETGGASHPPVHRGPTPAWPSPLGSATRERSLACDRSPPSETVATVSDWNTLGCDWADPQFATPANGADPSEGGPPFPAPPPRGRADPPLATPANGATPLRSSLRSLFLLSTAPCVLGRRGAAARRDNSALAHALETLAGVGEVVAVAGAALRIDAKPTAILLRFTRLKGPTGRGYGLNEVTPRSSGTASPPDVST